MEITSVKSEEQDEIEEILRLISGNEDVNKGELDEYIPKLANFSKNGLERKKVYVEFRIAYASSAVAFVLSVVPVTFACLLSFALSLSFLDLKYLPLLGAIVSLLVGWFFHGQSSWKRNYRLYALKMALIDKEDIA
jgi:hypothetical protein